MELEVYGPLVKAIVENDPQGVKQALDQGYSTSILLPNGKTPIHTAIEYGNRYECIKILLSHPTANINAVTRNEGATALYYACKYTQRNIVELLLNHPNCDINLTDEDLCSPLHVACYRKSFEIIQLLVSHGCLVDIQCKRKNTPLHSLFKLITISDANNEDRITNIVAFLLAHGADPTKVCLKGDTPFHYACQNGLLNCAKLLQSSSNVSVINLCNKDGTTPLMFAVYSRNIHVVKYLLSEGADANIKDRFRKTALHSACKLKDVEHLLLLLQYCTVIQPEDLLEFLEDRLFYVSEKIVETLLSLAPYYRHSKGLLYIDIRSDDKQGEVVTVPLQRVHSLASHCRSVIRRNLDYATRSTLSVFRKELLNLHLPESLVRYLQYTN